MHSRLVGANAIARPRRADRHRCRTIGVRNTGKAVRAYAHRQTLAAQLYYGTEALPRPSLPDPSTALHQPPNPRPARVTRYPLGINFPIGPCRSVSVGLQHNLGAPHLFNRAFGRVSKRGLTKTGQRRFIALSIPGTLANEVRRSSWSGAGRSFLFGGCLRDGFFLAGALFGSGFGCGLRLAGQHLRQAVPQ